MKRRQLGGVLIGLGMGLVGGWGLGACSRGERATSAQGANALVISAASSLKAALEDLVLLYQKSHPEVTLRFNFASSGALQQQIEQGAPADVFISAAAQPIVALEAKQLILPGSKRDFLSNQLVLITPAASASNQSSSIPPASIQTVQVTTQA